MTPTAFSSKTRGPTLSFERCGRIFRLPSIGSIDTTSSKPRKKRTRAPEASTQDSQILRREHSGGVCGEPWASCAGGGAAGAAGLGCRIRGCGPRSCAEVQATDLWREGCPHPHLECAPNFRGVPCQGSGVSGLRSDLGPSGLGCRRANSQRAENRGQDPVMLVRL